MACRPSRSPMAKADGPDRVALRATAPAKINLYLHVVGRRADGYHLLDSLIAFADVGDIVEVVASDALDLTIAGRFGAVLEARDGDNLVLRAARRLAQAGGVPAHAAIHLDKRLPVAAGLGGGSSDAAAALKLLDRLWRLGIGDDDLARLGLELGADVPVCLAGRTSFVGGIGDALAFAPTLPSASMLLVNPGVALSTAAVFAAREGEFGAAARFDDAPADATALAALLAARGNDLDDAATGLAPVVGEVRAVLAAQPGCLLARMSGSGATCFGLFADAVAAETAARALAADHADWWVEATSLMASQRSAVAPMPA